MRFGRESRNGGSTGLARRCADRGLKCAVAQCSTSTINERPTRALASLNSSAAARSVSKIWSRRFPPLHLNSTAFHSIWDICPSSIAASRDLAGVQTRAACVVRVRDRLWVCSAPVEFKTDLLTRRKPPDPYRLDGVKPTHDGTIDDLVRYMIEVLTSCSLGGAGAVVPTAARSALSAADFGVERPTVPGARRSPGGSLT
ncbi:hypothetical protein DE4576_00055 [Mycobacterium marinum]|nr:hypothetical protein DE4576_00055 [Mycobacterium marinum]